MRIRTHTMKLAMALACAAALVAFMPGISQAVEYNLKNFLILVDDQLILKGPADVICCQGAPVNARSDLGSRNLIKLGGSATTDIPDGAPQPAPPTLPDVAAIAPNVSLSKFAHVSMVIYDAATGSYAASGSGMIPPLAGHLYNNLGNNPLNDTGDKSLPDFPTFPTITVGAADVIIPTSGTVSLLAGNYRDLIIGAFGTVNFAESGTYQFRRIITTTASKYALNMLTDEIRINVKEFVRLSEYGAFNPTARNGITMYVEGVDASYGGANKNANGVTRSVGTYPAAFQYHGDGTFNACFVFVKNGTINLRGHQSYVTQWFGDSLQELSSLSISLEHPGEICYEIPSIQCACITDFKINKTTGILTVSGNNFSTKSVAKLAVFSPSAAVAGVQNLTGGDLGKDQLVASLNGISSTPTTTFTTQNNMNSTLGSGSYYLGIIYPINPNTGNTGGYCIFTDKALSIP